MATIDLYPIVDAMTQLRGSAPLTLTDVETLSRRLEHQHMLIQALLMLLLDKKVIEEQEFKLLVQQVDELDGLADGKVRETRLPLVCPHCRRKNPPSLANCMYCGESLT